jgi:hypothetical protein
MPKVALRKPLMSSAALGGAGAAVAGLEGAGAGVEVAGAGLGAGLAGALAAGVWVAVVCARAGPTARRLAVANIATNGDPRI